MNETGKTLLGLVFVTIIPAIGAFALGRITSKNGYEQGKCDALTKLKEDLIKENIIPKDGSREEA